MDLLTFTKQYPGGQVAFAKTLGVVTVCVNQWANGARKVPFERCIDIERLSNGVVTCEELRPDIAERWSYMRSTAKREGA